MDGREEEYADCTMDAPTPSSSSHPIFISRHDILYYITVAALFAAILGGTLWYADRNKQLGPSFDPARQAREHPLLKNDIPLAFSGMVKIVDISQKKITMEVLVSTSDGRSETRLVYGIITDDTRFGWFAEPKPGSSGFIKTTFADVTVDQNITVQRVYASQGQKQNEFVLTDVFLHRP